MSKKLNNKYEIVKSSKGKIDYKQYLFYILDNLSPLEVDKIFSFKQELIDSKKLTEDQANEHLLRILATPENVPVEVWMSLDEGNSNEIKAEDEDDFNFQTSSSTDSSTNYDAGDNYDVLPDKAKENEETFAQSSKIEKIGGSFELWPQKRIKAMIRDLPDEIPFTDMVNTIDVISEEEMQEKMNQTKYILFDKIGPKEIRESVPKETEVIVMDPPIEEDGMKVEELYEMFKFFKKYLSPPTKKIKAKKKKMNKGNENNSEKNNENENNSDNNNNESSVSSSKKFIEEEEEEEEESEEDNFNSSIHGISSKDYNDDDSFGFGKSKNRNRKKGLKGNIDEDDDIFDENDIKKKKNDTKLNPCVFIFIWAKPEHLSLISTVALCAGLLFCDTVVVEMLDGNIEYFNIVGKRGFVNRSKMIMIFRTQLIKNYQFVHQQNLDVAYGMCREQGKSRGRLGTPQSPHVIAENMLPRDKQDRIFVEIWPTRMSPRPGWLFIDEKC